MNKARIFLLALILATTAIGASWGQTDTHHPSGQPQPNAATAPQTAQPGQCPMAGGMMGGQGMMGQSGMMSGMQMMCSMPAMVADGDALYVVRGNDIFKFSKSDLKLLAQGTIPASQPTAMQPGRMPQPGAMQGQTGAMPGSMGASGAMACMTQMPPEMQQMMSRMQQMTPNAFDKSFLWNMMRHHQGAIEMSRLAVERAEHPELRRFAQKVIADQSEENQEFSGWLKSWYNTSLQVTPLPAGKEMIAGMEHLHGRDFEIQYMRNMIAHHSDAVCMGQVAEQKAEHPQLKAAASKIMTSQSREIQQLQGWLSAWYSLNS